MTVTAFAPISIGNYIIGFDILGAAMQPVNGTPLGDWVSVSPARENLLTVTGPYRQQLPEDPQENIVWDCLIAYHNALAAKSIPPREVNLQLVKAVPVGSGLGSSAASVVAALKALNLFYQDALDDQALLHLCGQLESTISGGLHYDNVSPCLFGGLQLMTANEHFYSRLVTPPWYYVLFHPGTQILTREARAVLPKQIPLAQTMQVAQRLAHFVHALHEGAYAQAAGLLQDTLIEPHRAGLIPLFSTAQAAALDSGALAYSIAGAGPTSVAVCESISAANVVEQALRSVYQHMPSQSWVCQLDEQGARAWPDAVPHT